MVIYTKLILFAFWIPQALRQLLIWIYWIQTKEYRIDRFKLLFRTPSGRENLQINLVLAKLILYLLIFIFREKYTVLIVIFILLNLSVIRDYILKEFKRPVFTQRAKRIFATAIIISFLPLFLGIVKNLTIINFFTAEIFLIISPFIGVLVTIPVVNRVKKEEILKAKAKILKVKPLVIGITGSYGKSTTKEFIAHLLASKYKTAKTSGSENTEFGIARKTKDFVKPGIKFFVVEMGAYKIGEIKKLAEIVSPTVGVITGIEEQHLSLFGSIENIKKAKFELIESLPSKAIAVFNLTNPLNYELYEKAKTLPTKLTVLGYMSKKDAKSKPPKADAVSEIIKADENKIKFKIYVGHDTRVLTVPLRGVHFIENLTGAILIARHFNVGWGDIRQACKTISLPEHTMQVYKLTSGAAVIDDTHNSTPSAFESALDYLNLFDRDKIVITSGIIELGKKSDIYHAQIGHHMSYVADKVILTNQDFLPSLSQGLGSLQNKLIFGNHDYLINSVEDAISKPDNVVLLEGRVPAYIYNLIERIRV